MTRRGYTTYIKEDYPDTLTERFFEDEPKPRKGRRGRTRLPWQQSKKPVSIYQEFLWDYEKAMLDEGEQKQVLTRYTRRLMHRGYTKVSAQKKLAQVLARVARQEEGWL